MRTSARAWTELIYRIVLGMICFRIVLALPDDGLPIDAWSQIVVKAAMFAVSVECIYRAALLLCRLGRPSAGGGAASDGASGRPS